MLVSLGEGLQSKGFFWDLLAVSLSCSCTVCTEFPGAPRTVTEVVGMEEAVGLVSHHSVTDSTRLYERRARDHVSWISEHSRFTSVVPSAREHVLDEP